MGDREQAELIKQDLAITFDEPLHRRNYSSAYQWSPLAFYTMAQIDEALGHRITMIKPMLHTPIHKLVGLTIKANVLAFGM